MVVCHGTAIDDTATIEGVLESAVQVWPSSA